jgi:hypothetical protein
MKTGTELEKALEDMRKADDAYAATVGSDRPTMKTTQAELDEMYKDKLFYEVIKTGPQEFRVFGPLDNIYYLSNRPGFIQVIDGLPKVMFTEDEIYVTKTPLVGGLSQLYKGAIENENR